MAVAGAKRCSRCDAAICYCDAGALDVISVSKQSVLMSWFTIDKMRTMTFQLESAICLDKPLIRTALSLRLYLNIQTSLQL